MRGNGPDEADVEDCRPLSGEVPGTNDWRLDPVDPSRLFRALTFAAEKHRMQRRKDAEMSPYINHPIGVAAVLVIEGGVTDEVTLLAALLHDTIEDTKTTPAELEEHFGPEVALVVGEVTDDKRLSKDERKALQIHHAPHVSPRAKQVKIADKICNVRDVSSNPPANWPLQRRLEYLDWTEKVVRGLRGVNPRLDEVYDRVLHEARQTLAGAAHPDGPEA